MSMIQTPGNVSKVRGALIIGEDPETELKGGVRHEDVVRTDDGSFCFLWDPEGDPLQFYESAFTRPETDPERLPA